MPAPVSFQPRALGDSLLSPNTSSIKWLESANIYSFYHEMLRDARGCRATAEPNRLLGGHFCLDGLAFYDIPS